MKVSGVPVYWDGKIITYTGEMTVCADGSPRAYGPEGCSPEPLDYLGNAGYPGNWWGITTDKYGNPYVQQDSSPMMRCILIPACISHALHTIMQPIQSMTAGDG